MKCNFSSYHNLGLCVMPLRGKHPLLNWTGYQTKRPDAQMIEFWDKTSHNIGIITGAISSILVVDVDGEYPSDWPEMPKTWTAKTSKGKHFYFSIPPESKYKNRTRIADNVDIRANGGYVVAPPSVHPDTSEIYTWEVSPDDIKILPVPDWLHEKLQPAAPVVKKTVHIDTAQENDTYIEAAITKELEILSSAPEGTRNDQLNKSAFALAQFIPHGLSEQRIIALLEHHALSIGLNHIETQKTIKSGIESGKAQPRDIPEQVNTAPEEPPLIVRNLLKRAGRKIEASEISDNLINNAPNMIGALVRWMNDTALYPQPVLALAAAIPAVGNIMAHRVATETDLRSNFFTLGIAESGAGKDHARKCIAKLYDQASMTDTRLGDPASATAVINAVHRANGQGLMMIDEFGRFMDSLKGNNAASHTRMITTNMMHMYNNANQMFTGQEYANNDLAGGRSDIDQPCLNIYATTVPHRFYNALCGDETTDGFLSRWLVFETTRFDIEPCIDNKLDYTPPELIDVAKWWQEQPRFSGEGGSISAYTTIRPRVVKYSHGARIAFYAYIKECRSKMRDNDDAVAKAFWNRAAEHAAKLALAGHEGEYITDDVFEWARQLSDAVTISMIDNIRANVSDNAYEADLNKILKIIRDKPNISKSEITRKTRGIDRRKRQDLLDTLVESGEVQAVSETGEGTKPITFYKIV